MKSHAIWPRATSSDAAERDIHSNRQRIATFVGLTLALGLPVILDLLFGKRAGAQPNPSSIIFAIAEDWILVLGLLGLVLLWERQPLSSIGLRRLSKQDGLWVVISFGAGALSFILTGYLVNALGLSSASSGIAQLAQIPLALRIGIVITAGIGEEILFRGYPIERLNHLTGRLRLSAIIAYTVFVLLHLPFWGLGGTLQIGVWSVIVTALYVRRRSLLACIFVHILNDAYAFILLPVLLTHVRPIG